MLARLKMQGRLLSTDGEYPGGFDEHYGLGDEIDALINKIIKLQP